jgi:hypothetical protein
MIAPLKYYQGKRVRFIPPDREWLEYHYLVLNKSSEEMGQMIESNRTYICNQLKKAGVPIKPKSVRDANHSMRMSGEGNPAWNGGTANNYHIRLMKRIREKRCQWCGATERVEVHHKDHNRRNGAPDNLEWLCRPCNRVEFWMWTLKNNGLAHVLIDGVHGKIEIVFTRRF